MVFNPPIRAVDVDVCFRYDAVSPFLERGWLRVHASGRLSGMTRIQMRSDLQQLLYILYTRSLISSNFMFSLSLFLFLKISNRL